MMKTTIEDRTNNFSNAIRSKSFAFALRIVGCYKYLKTDQQEYVLSKQLLRSGTAIGAMVSESVYAQSKADFAHKLSVALKETSETEYWIELLHQSDYLAAEVYASMIKDVHELLKMLTAIVKTTKSTMQQ